MAFPKNANMKSEASLHSGIPAPSPSDNDEHQRAFIERGLLTRDAVKASGVYVSIDAMLARLDDTLSRAKRNADRPPPSSKP
jgi:hypothetical protein